MDFGLITNHAELARIKTDPRLSRELHSYTDFATYYLTMDTYNPPFDNLKVRQAFSHAIDRDAVCATALQGFAIPAYSMLPPGYPAEATVALKPVQRYDPRPGTQTARRSGVSGRQGIPPCGDVGPARRTAGARGRRGDPRHDQAEPRDRPGGCATWRSRSSWTRSTATSFPWASSGSGPISSIPAA